MGKRNIFIILLLLCLIFTLPSISASDTIDPGGGTGDNLTDIPINNVLTLSYQEDSILTEGEGTFSELQGLIDTSSDGKVQLEKNYKFDPTKDDESLKEGILLNKKIEIDGNQFIIDGNNEYQVTILGKSIRPTVQNYLKLDSNQWSSAYEADALTHWAIQAKTRENSIGIAKVV